MNDERIEAALAPVEPGDERVEPGIALCLSGGGYRAMLFHVGALWRLNELGYLRRIARVSSVSGGSITAGTLALHWDALGFDSGGVAAGFVEQLVEPIRTLAGKTVDEVSIATGLLTPGTVAEKVAGAYRKHLFGDATLQALPDEPRFVINATNLQTGALWRFSRPYMADWKIGMVNDPEVALADAVAASSAFPPVLSPMRLELDPAAWALADRGELHEQPYTSEVVLSDGGVYDNLGLETAWKHYQTILVSDGGGKMQAEAEPKGDWARHALRINAVIDNQVRSLRKRQVMASFRAKTRSGTYWGVRSDIAEYQVADALPCPRDKTLALANIKTRLKRLEAVDQERLINWGYAICDAALRKWVDSTLGKPMQFPYPASGIG